MKFTILINQMAVVESGLSENTDLIDWALIDYVNGWITHPKSQRLGDKVWINFKHIIKEMPLLGLKAKSSISNRVTKLIYLGLLETEKDDCGRLFVSLTEKAHSVITFQERSQDATPVPENEQGVPNEEQGVPENEHSTNNNKQTTNNNKPKINKKVGLDLSEIDTPENLHIPTWQLWMEYKQQIKKPYKTEQGIKTAMNQLAELSHEQQEACINSSIMNEYQGFFVENFKGKNNAKRETTFEREERETREYLQQRERFMAGNEKQIPVTLGRTDGVKLV